MIDDMIDVEGFWLDDNEYCKIIDVEDEGAGLYVFQSLDDPTAKPWIGFIEDFSAEC